MSKGAKIAYVRVSTVDQNEARQVKAIEEETTIDRWFIEKVSAKDTNREQLQQMLEYVRGGDVIYIKDFSRMARSTKDLLEIIDKLNQKQVKLISLNERLDTSTPTGKLLVSMIASINEFERANLLERQKEGIAIAKEQGKYKGRKRIEKPSNWDEVYHQWKDRVITATEAMKLTQLKRNTFYKFIQLESNR